MNRNVWTSRKFWICVASALASLGTGISGIIVGNQTLAIIGSVCTVISAAIYAFCEAWVDAKAVNNDNFNDAVVNLLGAINNPSKESETK